MIFGRQDDNKRAAHNTPDPGASSPVVSNDNQYGDDSYQDNNNAHNGQMLPSIDLDESSLENAATYIHQVTDPSMVTAPLPTTYQPTPPDQAPQAYAPVPEPTAPPAPQHPKPRPAPKHTTPKPAAAPKPEPKNNVMHEADDLLSLKQRALNELTPLVGHLDQTPEERFRTTMMMIQSADNQSLIKDAYTAAQQIDDDKVRAQALLDVVNEINYFTQKKD